MDYQQTCIRKQKHLTNIYFYQNLRQLCIMAPITTVRGPLDILMLRLHVYGPEQLQLHCNFGISMLDLL